MKCFYHPEHDAVAMCKSCSRGLCFECAADVPPGVACRGKCEADVAALDLVIQRSKTAYQKAGAAHRRNALGMLIMGLLFVGFGSLLLILSPDSSGILFVLLGCVILLWAFFSHRSGRQISEVDYRSDAGASPTGGPARPVGNSAVTEGPPSVS